MGRKKIEYTEEEIKERNRIRMQKWRENNPEKEKILREKNNERKREKRRLYTNSRTNISHDINISSTIKFTRASNLLSAYNQSDKKYDRGKGNLTPEWILENIFTQPCKYCGKTGWDIIGCNRINNDLPHTIDNVEPCCKECNKKLPRKYV